LAAKIALLFSKLHILLERHPATYIKDESEEGINRDVSGNLIL